MIRSLYVHIPFCKSRCSYCDFVSFPKEEMEYDQYVDALIKELGFKKEQYEMSFLDTVYIGGGTPTVLPLSSLEKLLSSINENFLFNSNYEFTMEGNPESLTMEKLLLMKQYGVNRISLGVQSFNKDILGFLGRIHGEKQVIDGVQMAREAGINNINLDLIYGIPGESFESWKNTLGKAVSLDPEHISCYQLKIEEGTPLHEKLTGNLINQFPDDEGEKIYLWNLAFLEEKGYKNYEFSNYAGDQHYSKHNLTYWKYLPYAAAGFGGIGFYGNYRSEFFGSLKDYVETAEFSQNSFCREELREEQLISEYIIMNLRKNDGFSLKDFEERFNVSFLKIYSKQWKKLKDKELLGADDKRVFLTLRGKMISNLVLEEFV